MCLISPVFGANNANKGDVASMALLEYLGSLVETNEGLFGPDLFIKSGISDSTEDKLKNESTKNPATNTLRRQDENKLIKEASNENE